MNYKIYFLLLGGFFFLKAPLKAEEPTNYTTEQQEAIADTVEKLKKLTNQYKELGSHGDKVRKQEIINEAIPLLTSHDHEGNKVEGLEVLPHPDPSYTQAVKKFSEVVGSSVLDPIHKKFKSLQSTVDSRDPGAKNLKIIAQDMKTQSFANSAYYHMMMHGGGKRSFSEGDKDSRLKQRLHEDGLDDFDDTPKKELTREEMKQKLIKGRSKKDILADSGMKDDTGYQYNKKFSDKKNHLKL